MSSDAVKICLDDGPRLFEFYLEQQAIPSAEAELPHYLEYIKSVSPIFATYGKMKKSEVPPFLKKRRIELEYRLAKAKREQAEAIERQERQRQAELAEQQRQAEFVEQQRQREAARFPATYTDSVTGMEMVLVKRGCYQMGSSNNGDSDEKLVHEVCVDDFYIGKYEVTQKQWRTVMGNNPSRFKGDNRPVEQVSWHDAQKFISSLNQKTGKQYRVPTEAEWEYAARGGQNYKYSGSNNVDAVAWYDDNSGNKTHPVGQKQSNGFRLYDMSGNVWEWCSDWYASNYYHNSPCNNPQGPRMGSYRVGRGGSWRSIPAHVRAAARGRDSPGYRYDALGFRLVSSGQ